MWAKTVADRAIGEGHIPSFLSAMRILVELRDYDGVVPTRWRLSLLRTADVPELTPRVLLFTKAYTHRFPHESRWRWIREARVRSMIAVLRQRVSVAEMRKARQS